MSQQTHHLNAFAKLRIGLGALILGVLLAMAGPAQPAAASCGGTTFVSNEAELNAAITAFNAVTTTPCTFTIQLSADIDLTASTAAISNATAGIELVIQGDSYTLDGQGIAGVSPLVISNNTSVGIDGLTITGGKSSVTVDGGGLTNFGELTLTNSTVSGNEADDEGGGIANFGTMRIEGSTISGNISGRNGGGVINEFGVMTIVNSTISGNTTVQKGGGVFNRGNGSITIDSATIANNTSTNGGAFHIEDGTATIRNSILANSTSASDCDGDTGVINDGGHNLIESQTAPCSFVNGTNGNIVGSDPVLGPLADNGGPTFTHALLAGSPAIDAGDTLEPTDQRGEARPFGLADDIGALELQTCYVDSWSVANEAELNAAIACYNTKTVAGTYTITLTQDILLSDRLTDRSTTAIDNATAGVELVIEGSGFTVDGQDNFDVRPFNVQANTTVTMNDLTITGGNKIGGGVDNRGGGILNQGNLTLNRSTVISNTAETRGGGLATRGGTVAINDSTIANNVSGTPSSPGFGGGLHNENGQVTIRNSTISGNESVGGLSNNPSYGGGIASNDNITLDSVTVADNYALTGDGLYFINNTTSQVTVSVKNTILATNGFDDCHFETIAGGATFNDQGHNLILQDSTSKPCGIVNGVNNNIVADPQLLPLADNGGALTHAFRLDSPAIDAGDTSLPTDQRGVARPQDLADDIGALESTACGNDSWGVSRMTELNAAVECFNAKTTPDIYTISILDGGWPATLSTTAIDNSTPDVSLVIEGNGSTIDWNGDIFTDTRPFLIQANTTVTINDLFISNGDVRGSERGGAIRNLGNLTINRSTIAGSRAENSGGGISNLGVMEINDSTIFANQIQGGSAGVSGGGIDNEGSLTIRNSTISGNTSSNDGGGISSSGTLTLDSVTVTANSAAGAVDGPEGAGLYLIGFSTATIRNSILAGNAGAEDCSNLFSTITDNGHNLVQTQKNCGFADGVNGNIVGQSANLGPLRNNGGPTLTHALLPRSPAINAGDTPLTSDQRGESRPAGGADDIGAYEYQRASITIIKDARPESDDSFNFLTNIGGSGSSFALKDNGSDPNFITFSDLQLSSEYDVTEQIFQLPAGWVFDTILCSGGNNIVIVEASGNVKITLSAGEDVACTFTNKKLGTVIIQKNSVPAGGAGFSFDGDLGAFTLKDGGKETFADLPAGQYIVSENDPSGLGYELSGLSCVDSDKDGNVSTRDVANRTATIQLDPGETVRCTFTNTEENTVTVEKVTIPADSQSFGFDGGSLGAFNLSDGDIQGFTNVAAGAYTISEEDPTPAGYALVAIVCEDSATDDPFFGDLESRSVDFSLTQGERVHCTFTNEKLGTVIIRKATAPSGGAGFSFGGDLGDFTLKDGGKEIVANVRAGTYTVTENDPTATGYKLSGISCVDSVKGGKPSGGNVASSSALIRLDPGETVTCTFTNSQDDTITVEKVTVPESTTSFGFDGGTLGTFSVTGGSVKDFTGLSDGQYTISEDDPAPAGYRLTGINCVDSTTGQTFPGDLNSRSVQLDLTAGERVHCTFTNEKIQGDPAVRITESFQVTRVEEGKVSGEGSRACYWLTLASYTGVGDVVVNIGPPDGGEVTVNKSSVTLNSSNWNNLSLTDKSNFVCIRPIDDQIDDGGAQICRDGNSGMTGQGSLVPDKECGDHKDSVPHSIASATAPGYSTSTPIERLLPDGTNTVQDPNIPVLVQDNDDAGVVLTESYGVSDLDEDGTPVALACYWVTLKSVPTASVTVTPAPDGQVTVQPSSIVLNSSNWNALGADSNKICIRPVQDPQIEGTPNQFCADKKVDLFGTGGVDKQVCGSHLGAVDHVFTSLDGKYDDGTATAPVTNNAKDFGTGPRVIDVLIRDDDQPGVRLGVRSLNALEGQPASYGTRLLSQPNADVTLNVSTGTVSAASVGNTQLTFTPANWDVEQTVTLDLGDDDVANGSRTLTVRHSLSSSDSRFNGLVDESLTVNIVDDDSPGVSLLASAVSVGEDGSSDGYELRLTSRPSAPVTVAVSGDGQATPDRSSLTFTAQNWDQAQRVNVTAVDDRVAEENGDGLLQHGVSSDDPGYNGLAVGTMLVRIADNDVAGLAVGPPAQAVVVEGQRTTYAVTLRSQPTGSVQVRVSTDGRISASPSTLTFDAGNWNQAQSVTLTATDDRVDVRPDRQAAVVSHTAFSADAMYHELSVEGLTLAVQDDDVAALQLSTARLDLGAGQSGSYSVQLATEPTGEVLVELTAGEGLAVGQTGCTVEESGTPCLTFTPQNWDVAQNVTVTAETEAAGSIDHGAASSDAGYDGLGSRLSVNRDDSRPSIQGALFLPLISR